MAKKPDGLVADRPVLSLRPQAGLKQRLEDAAAESGRSMAREAEVRLEASFEASSASKLERYIKNRPGLSYLVGMTTPLEFTNQLGDVLLSVARHSEDQEWSEIQTREALASATATVSFWYFWTGRGTPPVPEVHPIPPQDSKLKDLPPDLAGFVIAESQMLFNSALQDHATFLHSTDGKIANAWSGDGKSVEVVPPADTPPHRKGRGKVKAAGVSVSPEELAAFKPPPPTWFTVLSDLEESRRNIWRS